MRLPSLLLATTLALLTASCATTPQSRIDKNLPAFQALPSAAQEKIRAGRVDLGFTAEMVFFALGEPDRKLARSSEAGEEEVWVYRRVQPAFGFGLGIGGGGGRTGYGGSLGISTSGYEDEEAMRVVFRAGKVSAIETRVK